MILYAAEENTVWIMVSDKDIREIEAIVETVI